MSRRLGWFPDAVARSTPSLGSIPQALLAEYVELAEIAKRKEHLRKEILGMLEHGRPVEPGALSASIKSSTSLQLSRAKLEEVIGGEMTQSIMDRIRPTLVQTLMVHEQH